MRLDRPLVRLPLQVDAARLAAELDAIEDGAWRDHPEGAPGNTALPLVAAGGDPEDDATSGPMAPTPHLARLPYARQVLAGLTSTIGRTRFMRIEHETELHAHVDTDYYWWHHLRVHVPVRTTPGVRFSVDDASVHMAAGEVWVFDTWGRHRVENPAAQPRTHLVVDTVGSARLWDLVEHPDRAAVAIPYDPDVTPLLPIETNNSPLVMAPAEVDATTDELLLQIHEVDPSASARAAHVIEPFRRDWHDAYARFGLRPHGLPTYRVLIDDASKAVNDAGLGQVLLPNRVSIARALHQLVLYPALHPDLAEPMPTVVRPASARRRTRRADVLRARLDGPPRIEDPIFVVSSPRAGSTLLFETLARAPGLWTIGGESHRLIERIAALTPAAHDWDSNRLEASDASDGVVAHLKDAFVSQLRDRQGRRPPGGATRLLEKTPKNALRVPFLATAFPDGRFVYLYRDPRETTSSMLDAWRSGRFVTYPELPGWEGSPWSLLLTPGWRELVGRSLAEVVCRQWTTTSEVLLDDLEALGPDRWCVASYDRLISDPEAEIAQVCAFLSIDWDAALPERLPNSRHTLDSPHPDKWRRNADELAAFWPTIVTAADRAREVFARPPRIDPVAVAPSTRRGRRVRTSAASPADGTVEVTTRAPDGTPVAAPSAEQLFSSRHSASFRALLRTLGASLAVTTYQAGRLILVRATDDTLNTHYRSLPTPMGLAFDGHRLAVGTKAEVIVFQDQPALARRLDPPDRHDGCFVTRHRHATGDIRIHDLAWADDGLWIVNTRFSCLCTLDDEHSFVPRWRPPFVRALAPEDRCHLNGLAVVDGRPKYVSVLGITDEANGWRAHKESGGALIDVESSETIAVGLSMPHSPRWHDGRLWVLESGVGALAVVDPATGEVERVAQVPGFARGLTFAGRYAFIGLSRVREHVFDGLPLTRNRTEALECGIWVIDTTTGATIAHLAFDGLVQEIFEVALLTGLAFPELVEPGAPLSESAYVLPEAALAEVPSKGAADGAAR